MRRVRPLDYLKVFGANLQRARELRGLTQTQFGRRVGRIAASYVSRVEHGHRNISVAQCVKFAQAVETPLEVLFDPRQAVVENYFAGKRGAA